MDHVDVYFDYASPFAYLASEVLPEFAEALDLALAWKPIDQLKLSNYADGLPYSAKKRVYVAVDAVRSAQFHDVPIRVAKPHPVESGRALRLAAAARSELEILALHRAIFRAAWRDQRDVSMEDVLADCLLDAEMDAEMWLLRSEQPPAEASLHVNTDQAETAGVFGVPTFVLNAELFWGLDSLPALRWRLEQTRA